MKFTYDQETDSLYIDVADRPGVDAREIAPGVVADFDAAGRLVGLDVEDASQRFTLSEVELEGLPLAKVAARAGHG